MSTGFLAAFICILFFPMLMPFGTKLFTKPPFSSDTVTTNPEEQRLCQRPCQENAPLSGAIPALPARNPRLLALK